MLLVGRRPKPPPGDFLAPEGTWPDGPFKPDAPAYVPRIATLARRLIDYAAERGWSQRALAEHTGVNLNTINYIFLGRVIPDTATLATLEATLNISLWPEGTN